MEVVDILRCGTAAFMALIVWVNLAYKRRWDLLVGTMAAVVATFALQPAWALLFLRVVFLAHALALPFGSGTMHCMVGLLVAVICQTAVTMLTQYTILDVAFAVLVLGELLVRRSSCPYCISAFRFEWACALLCWVAGTLLEQHEEETWAFCGWVLLWAALTVLSTIPVAFVIADDVEEPCLLLNGAKDLLVERVYSSEKNELGAWFHALPLYESGRRDDFRRRFFPWKDEDAMFMRLDDGLHIWRCKGLLPAELLIYVESRAWMGVECFRSLTPEAMPSLRDALLALANGMEEADVHLRYALRINFPDKQLRELRNRTREHTCEWTSSHDDLNVVLRNSEDLSIYTRNDLRVFCMHAERRTTIVDEPSMQKELAPLFDMDEKDAWSECLAQSPTLWDALAYFGRHACLYSSWITLGRAHLARCRDLYLRTLLAPKGELEPFGCAPLHQWVDYCSHQLEDEALQQRCVRVLLTVYYAWRARPRSILLSLLQSQRELVVALEQDVQTYLRQLWDVHLTLSPVDAKSALEMDVFRAMWCRYCHGVYGNWIFEGCPPWVLHEQVDPDRAAALRHSVLGLLTTYAPVAVDRETPLPWLCLLWLAFIIEFSTGHRMEDTLAIAGRDHPSFGLSAHRPLAHANAVQSRLPVFAPWVKMLSDLACETVENPH